MQIFFFQMYRLFKARFPNKQKKWVSYLYRTATTAYPCSLPGLGEFSRSWSYKTYPLQKYKCFSSCKGFIFNFTKTKKNFKTMETKSTFLPAMQFGLLTGLAMIVYTLILYLVGVDLHSYWNFFSYLLFVGGMYWGMTSIREKQLGGVMTYGKAFGTGFWIAFFAALLLGIFSYFYLKYIDPSALANATAEAEDKILASNPDISDEDLQKALDMVKIFTNPVMSAVSQFISNLIVGTIFSLIIAIFAKREDRTLA